MTMDLIFPNQEAAPRTSNLVNSGKLTCNWKIIEKELIEKPGAVVTKLGTAQQRARTQSPSHLPTRRSFHLLQSSLPSESPPAPYSQPFLREAFSHIKREHDGLGPVRKDGDLEQVTDAC